MRSRIDFRLRNYYLINSSFIYVISFISLQVNVVGNSPNVNTIVEYTYLTPLVFL